MANKIQFDENGKVIVSEIQNGNDDELEIGEYEIPINERKVIVDKTDPDIDDICRRIDKGKLIARADFQRNYVWESKPEIKSKLIESVLLNIPIPVIYTAQIEEEKEEVIDGQQRILTFYGFKNNKFPLNRLSILKELNGKKFQDLSEDLQDKILNRGLSVIRILKESQKDIKFEIFQRLNRGSVKLNEQELRNCIYRGNFNDLLKILVKNPDFLRLQGLKEFHKRMVDVERILRFFAFCDKGERNYKSPSKQFLNNYIESKRHLNEKEIEEKKILFKKCVELCQQVFGDLAFRRYYFGDSDSKEGYKDSKINEGILDIQLYGFFEYDKRDILGKEQVIKDAFIDLVAGNKEFIETIEIGTYSTNQVKKRTEMWFRILRDIIGYPKNDRRIYTYEEKKFLFDKFEGVCQLCKNKISSIDDAHVDHIERFSEGGKTTIKNGQITHRYCNLHKG